MIRSIDTAAQQAKVAELKRLIKSGQYETQEKLEDAVDAFLWSQEEKSHEPKPLSRKAK